MAKDNPNLWTDRELANAIDTYVFLLQVSRAGFNLDKRAILDSLLGDLTGRNDASVRYRMRNISAVVVELGGPMLPEYGPAEQVGRNVRDRIRSILLAHAGFARILNRESSTPAMRREDVLLQLDALRDVIDDLERRVVGIGHNRPPEPMLPDALAHQDFDNARNAVQAIKAEVVSDRADPAKVEAATNRLLAFASKAATWLGQRATKFTDAALTVLAPVAVAQATGLLPAIINAVQSVMHFLHL